MILLWGLLTDSPLRVVHEAIKSLKAPVVFFNQLDTFDTEMELSVGSTISGFLQTPKQNVELENVTAIYLRPHDIRRLAQITKIDTNNQQYYRAINVEDMLLSWTEITKAIVINKTSAMATNSSKPYQSALIQTQGFKTPETLITTCPDSAIEFWQKHNTVIYKSISGVRSIVSRLTPEHKERIKNVCWCPTQFQKYISGVDYRVHVVKDKVFACEIESEVDDYRYASRQGSSTKIRPYILPDDVADKCLGLALSLNLTVAGIDLRRTNDGTWYCFEVNPSPGFTYYQQATNQPIAESIAELLCGGIT